MGKSSDYGFWREPILQRPRVHFNCRCGLPPRPPYPSYCDIIGACTKSIRCNEAISNPCAYELGGLCDGPAREFR